MRFNYYPVWTDADLSHPNFRKSHCLSRLLFKLLEIGFN